MTRSEAPSKYPVFIAAAIVQAWIRIALRKDVVERGIRVGLVVGTILVLINHGDALFSGTISETAILQMLFTYCVPFAVSTWASVKAIQKAEKKL